MTSLGSLCCAWTSLGPGFPIWSLPSGLAWPRSAPHITRPKQPSSFILQDRIQGLKHHHRAEQLFVWLPISRAHCGTGAFGSGPARQSPIPSKWPRPALWFPASLGALPMGKPHCVQSAAVQPAVQPGEARPSPPGRPLRTICRPLAPTQRDGDKVPSSDMCQPCSVCSPGVKDGVAATVLILPHTWHPLK